MISLSAMMLAFNMLVASYLFMVCATSPNPLPRQNWRRDRAWALANSTVGRLIRVIAIGTPFYHAVLVLSSHDSSIVCGHAANLNPQLFTWNPYTFTCLFLIICVGAPIRLAAYHGLGKRFTFGLTPPDELIITGVYHYVQHPSYSGSMIMLPAVQVLFLRWDAAPACWIPKNLHDMLEGWGVLVHGVIFASLVWIFTVRVRDEEKMLSETFRKEWEKWHQSTKRFIPGII